MKVSWRKKKKMEKKMRDEWKEDEDVIIEEVPREPREERKCPAHMYECKDTGKCIMIYQR